MSITTRFERIFIWLSGASSETLQSCPPWERRKYVAFGATVLVPSLFALMAAAYSISTLTTDWRVITGVSLVWSFIILTVDRALLATYRAYQSIFRKAAQFGLRIVVAGLMGMTISHPMTLLLFRDTIQSEVEKDRQVEIDQVRVKATEQKKGVEAKVPAVEAEIAQARERWNETFSAKFLEGEMAPKSEQPATDEEKKAAAELEKLVMEAVAPAKERLAAMDTEIATQDTAAKKLAGELNFWQAEFERELNGQRSGIVGLGPRAKSIQDDQLAWRRAESKRLSSVLENLTAQRTVVAQEIESTTQSVTASYQMKAVEAARLQKAEVERLAMLKQQVQQQQADQFVTQQNGIRDTLQKQIDAQLTQLKGLHEEIMRLGQDEESRIAALRAEPRKDILTQTLALHRLFDQGTEGGKFALYAYAILTLLFMLVDTIPLVVKFFSKAGPYDTLLDLDEVRFDRERKAFLSSFNKYMTELANGRLLHLTQNKPLERALIEGVDRSRAAKEFLESLMDLENAFESKVRAEREKLASETLSTKAAEKAAMLEDMVNTFYTDLRRRMEQFFSEGESKNVA